MEWEPLAQGGARGLVKVSLAPLPRWESGVINARCIGAGPRVFVGAEAAWLRREAVSEECVVN